MFLCEISLLRISSTHCVQSNERNGWRMSMAERDEKLLQGLAIIKSVTPLIFLNRQNEIRRMKEMGGK